MQAGPDAVYCHRRCADLELIDRLAVIRASVSAAAVLDALPHPRRAPTVDTGCTNSRPEECRRTEGMCAAATSLGEHCDAVRPAIDPAEARRSPNIFGQRLGRMGRICAQMFQFWRFTNQMMRYKVGLTVADRSLTRNWLAFVGDGNALTGLQSVTGDRKHDAGAEDARRELHDDRPDDLEQQRGAPFAGSARSRCSSGRSVTGPSRP